MARGRGLPGWLVTTGWVTLGIAAVGLPIALVVALLDTVRRTGSPTAQTVLLGGLVLLGIVLVVAVERGVSYAARELSISAALGIVAGVVLLVLLGVFVPGVGLVLVALLPAQPGSEGITPFRESVARQVVLNPEFRVSAVTHGSLVGQAVARATQDPRPAPRAAPSVETVRARAEERRAVVRARHERTREAVRRGYVGPGFTRGR